MARGGGKGRRTYARDARGRFASSGSSAPRRGAVKPGGGTLRARASLARSRSRLAAADATDRSISGTLSRRSQKGAVTRGKKALAQARKEARVRLNIGPKKGTIRKPKPKGRKAPPPTAPARVRQRSKAEQDQRNQIAAALKRVPKEKRAKFIKARKEMEAESRRARSTDSAAPLTQKERWARRSDVYRRAAARNRERAAALEAAAAPFARDYAFNTQPGNFPARRRVSSQLDRASQLRRKAKEQELRADELTRLATTNKGDAERARQAQRDAVSVEKGSRISTLMYGPGRVVRVNKKTISYYSDQTGSVINVDKSWVKVI